MFDLRKGCVTEDKEYRQVSGMIYGVEPSGENQSLVCMRDASDGNVRNVLVDLSYEKAMRMYRPFGTYTVPELVVKRVLYS